MDRRTFVRYISTLGTVAGIAPNLLSCEIDQKIRINRLGANFERGHSLRDGKINIDNPKDGGEYDVIIVGGGMTGLVIAYQLIKQGVTNILLLEQGDEIGGNSSSSKNNESAFPLGAHYLTLPNLENKELIKFMFEHDLINGFDEKNAPLFNEKYLTHAPDERLLIRGYFQEGLMPAYSLSPEEINEQTRFFELIETFAKRDQKTDKFWFNVPISESLLPKELEYLDTQTFAFFLEKHNFSDQYLLWYLDYCCRDDFGAGIKTVSAWAGIHYFASRHVYSKNEANVMTWPEGNGYLVKLLLKSISDSIKCKTMCFKVENNDKNNTVVAFDFEHNEALRYRSKHLVLACPTYVSKHLLPQNIEEKFKIDWSKYVHHPWLVAAVVLKKIPTTEGQNLSWDNVKMDSKGLGYIYNQNQSFKQFHSKCVVSVYLAFDKHTAEIERKALFSKTNAELAALVIYELESMHPNIKTEIESIDLQLWGHGMISPLPGAYQQKEKFNLLQESFSTLHLAHTDYSGISIFEEAFELGLKTANKISAAL